MPTIHLTSDELLHAIYAIAGEIACREASPGTLKHQKAATKRTVEKLRKVEKKLEKARGVKE